MPDGRVTGANLEVGRVFDLGTCTPTEQEILNFGRTWDPLDIHTDPSSARDSPYGGVIASGIHTMAMFQRLAVDHLYGNSSIKAGRTITLVRFAQPIRPGTRLHARVTILAVRRRSHGDYVIDSRSELHDDDGQLMYVLEADSVWL